ncbi:uncharacterized protein BDW70DRAFT_127489 [Aspergillus foveolatus]|uniref:uncharacterized protein n=1 Tax=Aspergillus foveolatus TaxID=210207 RepID=UPI003CCE1973
MGPQALRPRVRLVGNYQMDPERDQDLKSPPPRSQCSRQEPHIGAVSTTLTHSPHCLRVVMSNGQDPGRPALTLLYPGLKLAAGCCMVHGYVLPMQKIKHICIVLVEAYHNPLVFVKMSDTARQNQRSRGASPYSRGVHTETDSLTRSKIEINRVSVLKFKFTHMVTTFTHAR